MASTSLVADYATPWRERPVAVVGCGGLGVPAAWTLAHAGARRLRLIDDDHVELSNLHRQVLYAESDVGAAKAERLAAALIARFPDLEVDVRKRRLAPFDTADAPDEARDSLLAGCVAVVEGSDDAVCKFEVNDRIVRAWSSPVADLTRDPLFGVIAAAVARRGQWMVVAPSGACYRCLFEAPPPTASLATCETAGVLGPVVGHIGAAAARALVAALDGRPDPAHSALVRWGKGGYKRSVVPAADDCPCAAHRLTELLSTVVDDSAVTAAEDLHR